ncbi:MAG: hypothetical protein ABIR56_17575 [Polaromonas sp.]
MTECLSALYDANPTLMAGASLELQTNPDGGHFGDRPLWRASAVATHFGVIPLNAFQNA